MLKAKSEPYIFVWILQLGILETYIFGPKQLETILTKLIRYIFSLHIYPQVGLYSIRSDVPYFSYIFGPRKEDLSAGF